MKHRQKYVAALWAVGFALAMPATSHAFTGLQRSTQTATATLTGTGSVAMNVLLFNNGSNSPATSIAWTGVTLPSGDVLSNQYIQLASTVTAAGGGVEIYTDNTAADAGTSKYEGNPATINPAGLVEVNASSPTPVLPLAWKAELSTTVPTAVNPNTDPAFSWEFFEDRATVAIPSANTTAFADGASYETVKNAQGVQTNTTSFFGGSNATAYIFTEADFSGATTPNSYATNTLRLEAFTQ